MRKLYSGVLAGAFVLFAGAACDDDDGDSIEPAENDFAAELNGANERPTPVTTTATGTATVTINEANSTITYTLNVANLLDPNAAHIHTGGPEDAGPPIVTFTLNTVTPGTPFTGLLASGTAQATDIAQPETFASLVQKIRNGQTYVNVHTAVNTGGEIRGQLEEDD